MTKFKGIKAPESTAASTEIYRGAPCIYHSHSGFEGTANSWRQSSDHACLECLDSINSGAFSLDISKLTKKYQYRAHAFWNNVNIDGWDDCWRWNGDLDKHRHLYSVWPRPDLWKTYRHHPVIIVNWLVRGDIGRHGITSLCGENRCVNPLHQIPTGIKDKQLARNYLEEQRDLLLYQLAEYARPTFDDIDLPDFAYQSRFDKAYDQAMRNLNCQLVRQM